MRERESPLNVAMPNDFQADVEAVSGIEAVPTILEVVCRTTGMGFAAVARVTENRWIACSVRDKIAFGLHPGGELKVETREKLANSANVAIDHLGQGNLGFNLSIRRGRAKFGEDLHKSRPQHLWLAVGRRTTRI
jgi:hypothetical protein